MYTVGLDVDKLVSTVKILLYAGNSCICSPLALIALGTIYYYQFYLSELPAGNLGVSTKVITATEHAYNKFTLLPLIPTRIFNYRTNLTNEEFGYFLAGLIEGHGLFVKKELHIVFTDNDVSLAYFIKKRIGYGCVYKIKDKKKVKYICNNQKGLYIILCLVNGKLINKYKYQELINHRYDKDFNVSIVPPLYSLSLDNYWLSGFTQANGQFQISAVKSKKQKTKHSIILEYSLEYNDSLPLELLLKILKKGNIVQCGAKAWCYKSSSFYTAADLIKYFDRYNLFGEKYIDYIKFRKVYTMITKNQDLEDKGKKKIISIATKGSSETSTQEV